MVTWARNKAVTLGRVNVMTLEQARTEAAQYLAEAHAHGEPLAVSQERKAGGIPTLETFLVEQFEPWSQSHHRDATNSSRAIRKSFADLLNLRLDEIDTRTIEKLRTNWIAEGLTPASANRNITRLRGVLSRAVEWGLLPRHPLEKLKCLKVDKRGRVRHLSLEEELALRQAMEEREEEIFFERDSANKWRADRNKELLPDLRKYHFADHLKPLVITALNTGMRRGEIFNLTWKDVDLEKKIITVEGTTSKSGQSRYISINDELLDTLIKWKKQTPSDSYAFPGKNGKRLDNIKKSWENLLVRAKIEGFRWHDIRHTFASNLVMAGISLYQVRDILGHSDFSMTQRYAHLSQDSKAAAVAVLSLSLRLSSLEKTHK